MHTVGHGNDDGHTDVSTNSELDHSKESIRLHCYNVWFTNQLPWNAASAMNNRCNCIFSVVQSTTQVKPSEVYRQWKDELSHR